MNNDPYDDLDDIAYEEGLIRTGEDTARRNLAAILNNLRKRGDFPSPDYTCGYQDALDQVATSASITIVTEVRYT